MMNIRFDYDIALQLDFDPSQHTTQAGAAKALYKALCKLEREIGGNPDTEVHIYSPEQSKERGYTTGWQVVWESGPYQWAIAASTAICNHEAGWYTEPYYSFDLCFERI